MGYEKNDDYIEVPERVTTFYEKYPDGRIETVFLGLEQDHVVMKAVAYRTPEDPVPGTGHSWLKIPGKTPFTNGSEIENAETSAVGRALFMVGIETRRGVATREEVESKRAPEQPLAVGQSAPSRQRSSSRPATDKQRVMVRAASRKQGLDEDQLKALSHVVTGKESSKDWTMDDVDKVLQALSEVEPVTAA